MEILYWWKDTSFLGKTSLFDKPANVLEENALILNHLTIELVTKEEFPIEYVLETNHRIHETRDWISLEKHTGQAQWSKVQQLVMTWIQTYSFKRRRKHDATWEWVLSRDSQCHWKLVDQLLCRSWSFVRSQLDCSSWSCSLYPKRAKASSQNKETWKILQHWVIAQPEYCDCISTRKLLWQASCLHLLLYPVDSWASRDESTSSRSCTCT